MESEVILDGVGCFVYQQVTSLSCSVSNLQNWNSRNLACKEVERKYNNHIPLSLATAVITEGTMRPLCSVFFKLNLNQRTNSIGYSPTVIHRNSGVAGRSGSGSRANEGQAREWISEAAAYARSCASFLV